MTIRWSKRALGHMGGIHAWLSERNPDATAAHLQRIGEATERLPTFPGLGRPGRLADTRELVVTGTPYVVPYTVAGDEILILAVLHHSQRWPPP